MRIGVITFPGTIDDRETAAAITAAGAEPIELWHNEANLARVDAVVLPGGAAHGNYLRPGALAAHAPIMTRVLSAADRKSTRLNSSHVAISYAVFCLKKNKKPPH